jgi:DNA-binding transcriptional regulator LsrR (DeoR family)
MAYKFKVHQGTGRHSVGGSTPSQNPRVLIEQQRERVLRQAELARKHWLDGLKLKQLDSSASRASRELSEAVETHVVAFDIDASFGFRGRVDKSTARRLAEEFGLQKALVIDVKLLDDSHKEDDHLHVVLANHFGEELAPQIESGWHLAVGGGRASHQVARFIRRVPGQQRRQGVTVTAISGQISANYWEFDGPAIKRPVDADDVAFILASTFAEEPGARFRRVDHTLFQPSPEVALSKMEGDCAFLPDGTWSSAWGQPTKVIAGVGSLNPVGGHRLKEMGTHTVDNNGGPADAGGDHLRDARIRLATILNFANNHHLEYPGDVANRLFPAFPDPGRLTAKTLDRYGKSFDHLGDLVRELNRHMVVVNWSHLRKSRLLVVAGGGSKLHTLWTLLFAGVLTREPLVTEICTDSVSANHLLAMSAAAKALPQSVRDWYKECAARIFS